MKKCKHDQEIIAQLNDPNQIYKQERDFFMAKEKTNFDRYKTSDEMNAAADELAAVLRQLRKDARQLEAKETAERERRAREMELRENAELGRLSREVMIGNASIYDILKMSSDDRQSFFGVVSEAKEIFDRSVSWTFNNGSNVHDYLLRRLRADRDTEANAHV